MKRDISIENNEYRFKYRVSGLLIKDNKLLVVRINNNKFYCLPGGHVELMEDTKSAIIREFKEETGIDTYIEKLLYITENFFDSTKKCHEVGFYYLLNTKTNIEMNNFNIVENDNGEDVNLDFKWVDIKEMENVKPDFLKDKLNLDVEKLEHIIIKNDKII